MCKDIHYLENKYPVVMNWQLYLFLIRELQSITMYRKLLIACINEKYTCVVKKYYYSE